MSVFHCVCDLKQQSMASKSEVRLAKASVDDEKAHGIVAVADAAVGGADDAVGGADDALDVRDDAGMTGWAVAGSEAVAVMAVEAAAADVGHGQMDQSRYPSL